MKGRESGNSMSKNTIIAFIKMSSFLFYIGVTLNSYSAGVIGKEVKEVSPQGNTYSKTYVELFKKREANSFYLLESSIDTEVCSGILASINKSREHRYFENDEALRKGTGGKVNLGLPEMMLQTELNLQRIVMSGKNASSSRVEEFVVDLNRDGIDEFVYRTTGYLSGVWVHSLYVLSMPYDSKKYSRFGEFMIEQRNLGNISKFLWQWREFDDLKSGVFSKQFGSQVIYELIEFNERYYILVTRSVIKENSAIKVAALELDNMGNIHPGCFFETNFIVTH